MTLLLSGSAAATLLMVALRPQPAQGQTGSFRPIEISFQLSDLTGNPFDYQENDIRVSLQGPDGKAVSLPAFYDGDSTWRIRHTPSRTGKYRVREVTRNGKKVSPKGLMPSEVTVSEDSLPGFVRVDPKNPLRFAFDNGTTYYPVGMNVAWKSGDTPDVPDFFARMGQIGLNWSRVWMNHWDGKNIDWVQGKPWQEGRFDLEAARKWDAITRAAEQHGIYYQLVLQHHGQYSSTVNPNWGENPWNKANGGFLEKPEDFFTDERAKKLTKARYRYMIARYGYSPAIMAWELFNEVQFTDAGRKKQYPVIVDWHKEMAAFLREQDPYKHLVTTSSEPEITGLFDAMDFVQLHAYEPDGVSTVRRADPQEWGKPVFFGEIGPSGDLLKDDGAFLHTILWASLVSDASGAAQYWTWDHIHRANLYPRFQSFTDFLKQVDYPAVSNLESVPLRVQTKEQGSLSFGPGGGWGKGKGNEFIITEGGMVRGAGDMPSYLQGKAHPDLFTHAEFPVEMTEAGTFEVTLNQIARAGAQVVVKVDGKTVAEKAFPATERDTDTTVTLSAPVPSGKHTIRLENIGADWIRLSRLSLSPFGATLQAFGKGNSRAAVLWLRNTRTGKPSEGTVQVGGLENGLYSVLWWDTQAGKMLKRDLLTKNPETPLPVPIPPIAEDIAVFIRRHTIK
ncbi:MAG: hypothetical protein OHK0029_35790 [Armatimonadaceae bacterium]